MLIDPPVGPYDPPEAVRAWLARLAQMPQGKAEVQDAIIEAQRWLEAAERRERAI